MTRSLDVSRPPRAHKCDFYANSTVGLFVAFFVILASLSLSGCAGYTTNASSGNGGNVGNSGGGALTPSATSISFGNLAVGSTSTKSVSVTNTGTGTVNISGAAISGGVFTVVGGSASNALAVGQTATVQVQFAPTSMTPATGTLTVTSDATNSSLAIALTGTGLEAIPVFSPSSLNFNNIPEGQTSTQTVTLSNTGNATLTITAVSTSGTGVGINGLSLPAGIAANQSTTFSVPFTPQSTMGVSGGITFTDNGVGSQQTLTVTGSAVTSGSTLGANPGSFNFNTVLVGSNSTQAITLTNSGNSTITISSVTPAGSGFSDSGIAAGQTIAAGATATVTAKFAPTGAGAATGTITINSTATNSPLVIALSGTGTQGTLSANPSSINFGSLLTGNTASVNVTLTNTGTANVAISAASASGTAFSMSTLSPQTLTPGGTAVFTATFAPTTAGNASGSVSITSNAPVSPLVIGLSGVGTANQAQLSMNPSSIAFNTVNVGSNASHNVTLTNTGNVTLNIAAATISGAGYTMNLVPASINAGANITFSVTFTPTSGGSSPGAVSIASNDPNSPSTIALTGTGLQAQIAATPTSVGFGTVTIGNTDSQSITLRNNGNTTLTFSQVTLAGTGFNETGLTTSTTIAAGSSTTFNATFNPSSTSTVNGSITLATNGTPSSLVINLSGTGQAATMLLGASPTSLPFGNVLDASSTSLTTSVTNNGNANVTISTVTVSGARFSASGIPNGTVLTAGQSSTLTVTFAPTSGGAVSGASVSIASNATNSPLTIGLTGSGTHSVVLTWGASTTGGVTYNVFRGTTAGGEGSTPVNSSAISQTTYTDTGVTPGQQYYYVVEAVDGAGSSSPSNEVPASIPNP